MSSLKKTQNCHLDRLRSEEDWLNKKKNDNPKEPKFEHADFTVLPNF